jgi:hypothetical protein
VYVALVEGFEFAVNIPHPICLKFFFSFPKLYELLKNRKRAADFFPNYMFFFSFVGEGAAGRG